MDKNYGESFAWLYDIVKKLRDPGGCPWDREQTPESLRANMIEECYECVAAINEGDAAHIKEELGDVALQVVLLSYIYEQAGSFSIADVLDTLAEKLVRRHPHVFGTLKVADSAEVLKNWAEIKVKQEGRKARDSVLDEVKRGLPPLEKAFKLQKKAAKTGFDWETPDGVFEKMEEELAETREAAASASRGSARLEEELGDVLFTAVNLARAFGVDASLALERANEKFSARFRHVERRMKESGIPQDAEHREEMEMLWNEAKNAVRNAASSP